MAPLTRCFHYDDDGNPWRRGCMFKGCTFVHPDDTDWDSARKSTIEVPEWVYGNGSNKPYSKGKGKKKPRYDSYHEGEEKGHEGYGDGDGYRDGDRDIDGDGDADEEEDGHSVANSYQSNSAKKPKWKKKFTVRGGKTFRGGYRGRGRGRGAGGNPYPHPTPFYNPDSNPDYNPYDSPMAEDEEEWGADNATNDTEGDAAAASSNAIAPKPDLFSRLGARSTSVEAEALARRTRWGPQRAAKDATDDATTSVAVAGTSSTSAPAPTLAPKAESAAPTTATKVKIQEEDLNEGSAKLPNTKPTISSSVTTNTTTTSTSTATTLHPGLSFLPFNTSPPKPRPYIRPFLHEPSTAAVADRQREFDEMRERRDRQYSTARLGEAERVGAARSSSAGSAPALRPRGDAPSVRGADGRVQEKADDVDRDRGRAKGVWKETERDRDRDRASDRGECSSAKANIGEANPKTREESRRSSDEDPSAKRMAFRDPDGRLRFVKDRDRDRDWDRDRDKDRRDRDSPRATGATTKTAGDVDRGSGRRSSGGLEGYRYPRDDAQPELRDRERERSRGRDNERARERERVRALYDREYIRDRDGVGVRDRVHSQNSSTSTAGAKADELDSRKREPLRNSSDGVARARPVPFPFSRKPRREALEEKDNAGPTAKRTASDSDMKERIRSGHEGRFLHHDPPAEDSAFAKMDRSGARSSSRTRRGDDKDGRPRQQTPSPPRSRRHLLSSRVTPPSHSVPRRIRPLSPPPPLSTSPAAAHHVRRVSDSRAGFLPPSPAYKPMASSELMPPPPPPSSGSKSRFPIRELMRTAPSDHTSTEKKPRESDSDRRARESLWNERIKLFSTSGKIWETLTIMKGELAAGTAMIQSTFFHDLDDSEKARITSEQDKLRGHIDAETARYRKLRAQLELSSPSTDAMAVPVKIEPSSPSSLTTLQSDEHRKARQRAITLINNAAEMKTALREIESAIRRRAEREQERARAALAAKEKSNAGKRKRGSPVAGDDDETRVDDYVPGPEELQALWELLARYQGQIGEVMGDIKNLESNNDEVTASVLHVSLDKLQDERAAVAQSRLEVHEKERAEVKAELKEGFMQVGRQVIDLDEQVGEVAGALAGLVLQADNLEAMVEEEKTRRDETRARVQQMQENLAAYTALQAKNASAMSTLRIAIDAYIRRPASPSPPPPPSPSLSSTKMYPDQEDIVQSLAPAMLDAARERLEGVRSDIRNMLAQQDGEVTQNLDAQSAKLLAMLEDLKAKAAELNQPTTDIEQQRPVDDDSDLPTQELSTDHVSDGPTEELLATSADFNAGGAASPEQQPAESQREMPEDISGDVLMPPAPQEYIPADIEPDSPTHTPKSVDDEVVHTLPPVTVDTPTGQVMDVVNDNALVTVASPPHTSAAPVENPPILAAPVVPQLPASDTSPTCSPSVQSVSPNSLRYTPPLVGIIPILVEDSPPTSPVTSRLPSPPASESQTIAPVETDHAILHAGSKLPTPGMVNTSPGKDASPVVVVKAEPTDADLAPVQPRHDCSFLTDPAMIGVLVRLQPVKKKVSRPFIFHKAIVSSKNRGKVVLEVQDCRQGRTIVKYCQFPLDDMRYVPPTGHRQTVVCAAPGQDHTQKYYVMEYGREQCLVRKHPKVRTSRGISMDTTSLAQLAMPFSPRISAPAQSVSTSTDPVSTASAPAPTSVPRLLTSASVVTRSATAKAKAKDTAISTTLATPKVVQTPHEYAPGLAQSARTFIVRDTSFLSPSNVVYSPATVFHIKSESEDTVLKFHFSHPPPYWLKDPEFTGHRIQLKEQDGDGSIFEFVELSGSDVVVQRLEFSPLRTFPLEKMRHVIPHNAFQLVVPTTGELKGIASRVVTYEKDMCSLYQSVKGHRFRPSLTTPCRTEDLAVIFPPRKVKLEPDA